MKIICAVTWGLLLVSGCGVFQNPFKVTYMCRDNKPSDELFAKCEQESKSVEPPEESRALVAKAPFYTVERDMRSRYADHLPYAEYFLPFPVADRGAECWSQYVTTCAPDSDKNTGDPSSERMDAARRAVEVSNSFGDPAVAGVMKEIAQAGRYLTVTSWGEGGNKYDVVYRAAEYRKVFAVIENKLKPLLCRSDYAFGRSDCQRVTHYLEIWRANDFNDAARWVHKYAIAQDRKQESEAAMQEQGRQRSAAFMECVKACYAEYCASAVLADHQRNCSINCQSKCSQQ